MGRIEKLEVLSRNKFLSLYNAEYTNKTGTKRTWTIASRKEENSLNQVYFEGRKPDVDAVVIVPFHEETERLVIIKQFRVPVNDYVYELPAGLIDNGEDPVKSIKRELMEETGLKVTDIIESKSKTRLYLSPGMTDECVYMSYCTCSGTVSKEFLEDDEDIETILLTREEAKELLKNDAQFDIKCFMILQNFVKLGKKLFE